VSTDGAPARNGTAVWTGTEMIVWNGDGPVPEGGRYNPAADSWSAVAVTGAPQARIRHTAVWTGSEMIVWGGRGFDVDHFYALNTGGRYNPASNSWTATTIAGAPPPRYYHTAVWTGNDLIVWGGYDEAILDDEHVRNDTWSYTPGKVLILYQRP
jgi:N-acetylneuraminic acid mutarotase